MLIAVTFMNICFNYQNIGTPKQNTSKWNVVTPKRPRCDVSMINAYWYHIYSAHFKYVYIL